jgi:hypothetical protein
MSSKSDAKHGRTNRERVRRRIAIGALVFWLVGDSLAGVSVFNIVQAQTHVATQLLLILGILVVVFIVLCLLLVRIVQR